MHIRYDMHTCGAIRPCLAFVTKPYPEEECLKFIQMYEFKINAEAFGLEAGSAVSYYPY